MTAKGTGVIYGRFSQKEKDDKVVTLESQFKDERVRAKRDGFAVVAEFQDDGISAWDKKKIRPGWNDMLDYVQTNNVDRIYTRESDRSTRDQDLTGALLAFCAENGVTLVEGGAVTGPKDPDAQDMRRLKAMFDERFSRSISIKVRKARELAAEAGRPHGGIRPFGWGQTAKDGKELADSDRNKLHPTEGPAYRELFDLVIGGMGVSAIARQWEADGIRNSKGQRFDVSCINRFVKSPRAIGVRVHHAGQPDEMSFEGDWEPIVTKKIQDRAIAAMRGRRNLKFTGPKRAPQLLSGLVVCAEKGCGQTMRVRTAGNARAYLCDRSKSRCCGKTSIKAEALEREIELLFLARLTDPKTIRDLKKRASSAPDLADLSDELERLQADLDAYTHDASLPVRDGGITHSELTVIRKGLVPQIEKARAALEAAQATGTVAAFSPSYVLKHWETADLDDRRRFLSAYLDHVDCRSASGRGSRIARADLSRITPLWL